MTEPIRVAVIDDEAIIRAAIGGAIRNAVGFELVGTAADAHAGLALIEDAHPDVAIVDVRMGGGGENLTAEIRRRHLATRIVVLSAYSDRDTVVDMLSAGASAYVVKGAPISEVLDACRAASSGHGQLEQRIVPDVVDELGERIRRERRLAARRQRIRERMEAAIAVGPRMVYQPIVDLATGRTTGYEALSRFDLQPPRTPDKWFREAASIGRLVDLELRTLDIVLHAARPADAYLSVNVHPMTIVSPEWRRAVGRFDWTDVVVEVTEHDAIHDWPAFCAALKDLRGRGVRTSVDDAGSGFSSLSQILRIRPDYIKLDGFLTQRVDQDPARRALATALQGFAVELGSSVIAERIETAGEAEMIREIGIPFGQGYLFGKPAPLPEKPVAARGAGRTGG